MHLEENDLALLNVTPYKDVHTARPHLSFAEQLFTLINNVSVRPMRCVDLASPIRCIFRVH